MTSKQSNSSSQGKSDPVVTAVPITAQGEVIQVHAQAERIPRTDLERMGLENETIGVCRRCRRQFERPPGVHDGSAQYYRCPECAGIKFEDVLYSCTIS
jgi:DNA-directed RNA polymerase subunit RPC12/RpoP